LQKVEISQEELNQGNGRFNDYMRYVAQRLSSKSVDPRVALFSASDQIRDDGLQIEIGSFRDDAGLSVVNWMTNFYGERHNISHCLPPVACQINGLQYLLRMPILRPDEMLVTQAVIDLTATMSKEMSNNQFSYLDREYNEFYSALYKICLLDATTVVHLESSAQRIYDGATHYALSRWESLHFVERAMKEVLDPLGVKATGKDGHDVKGVLHDKWILSGKLALPDQMLSDVMCSAAIRYERTPQPFLATLKAHHAAIRLGALIASEILSMPPLEDKLSIPFSDICRNPALSVARIMQAIDASVANWQPVKLKRPK
jgi:hypothetical protein